MISPRDEYDHLITQRLEENRKSFHILFDLKHYGNCISILCQELDQTVKVLFLLKRTASEKQLIFNSANNSQKWYLLGKENKKEYITETNLTEFANSLEGWEKSVHGFGISFKSLSANYNYLLKNPILSLKEAERDMIHQYICDYHQKDFPVEFSLNDIIPILPQIYEKISAELKEYIKQL